MSESSYTCVLSSVIFPELSSCSHTTIWGDIPHPVLSLRMAFVLQYSTHKINLGKPESAYHQPTKAKRTVTRSRTMSTQVLAPHAALWLDALSFLRSLTCY
jgi:hypothetical protein